MKNLKEFNLQNKRVLVRCDFNVPLDKEGNILDDFRIKETLPTIEYLIQNKAKIILISHLGRPDGKIVEALRLDPVQKKLEQLLGAKVIKINDCVGTEAENKVSGMDGGEIIILENVRFHKEEDENDENFAKEIANLGEVYINDAFADSHRTHASITGIPRYLPSAAGLLLEKEISVLSGLMDNPKEPLVVLIGGAKVEETKLKLIERFSWRADAIIISGLIAIGIKEKGLNFSWPEKITAPGGDLAALDINEESVKIFQDKIRGAKTVFWNGPFGKIEEGQYAKGTKAIAEAIIKSGAFSVIGGGETVEFINNLGWNNKFSHVSTGGGAMLAFLSGEKLPGIEALE